jgi:hypothetical protein
MKDNFGEKRVTGVYANIEADFIKVTVKDKEQYYDVIIDPANVHRAEIDIDPLVRNWIVNGLIDI